MDVLSYAVAVGTPKADQFSVLGLALETQLRCRVCQEVVGAQSASELRPDHLVECTRGVQRGYRALLKFLVEERTALQRACDNCGSLSIVPRRQVERLTKETENAVNLEWLRQAVEELTTHRSTRRERAPLPDDSEYDVSVFIVQPQQTGAWKRVGPFELAPLS